MNLFPKKLPIRIAIRKQLSFPYSSLILATITVAAIPTLLRKLIALIDIFTSIEKVVNFIFYSTKYPFYPLQIYPDNPLQEIIEFIS